MLTLILFPFKILEGIILVSYVNINLHIPGGQTGGRSCVTQVTLCTEGTYCLPVPLLYLNPGESSAVMFPINGFRDITQCPGD